MTRQHIAEKLAEAKTEYVNAEFAFKDAISKQAKHEAEDSLLFWSRQINYFQNYAVTPDVDWEAVYAIEDQARGEN